MLEQKTGQQELLFALDIGTRSVIGIVGRLENGLFHVLDSERQEHQRRTMYDGQIEDIDQVARLCAQVKERLEQRLGIELHSVCVAAAGRALQTRRASFVQPLDPEEPISSQMVYQLEMGAIGLAQEEVNQRLPDQEQSLFCVGHSVIGYRLDDYPMSTLLGHKGKEAQVEIIATFLPNQVVDSLRSTMRQADLNIANMTLEPIAAMNAVIPSELRLLNLALVDIGAGTSDIAIADGGSVVAYTMATTAGDEITEGLMKRYLVDFATAEQMKRAPDSGEGPYDYTDVLGFDYTITREELLEALQTPVEALAQEICSCIQECNQKSPVAVFLVGGGSKVPLLPQTVARLLGLDEKKVAVGGSGYMKKQTTGLALTDPEYATPLGIALTAAFYAEQHATYVYVNDQKVQMLRSAGLTVMNALLMCGYKYGQLMGKSGRSVSFSLNGEEIVCRGGLPQPAEITVNNSPASIAAALECGDRVVMMPAVSGVDAVPRVGDFMKTKENASVMLDGIPCTIDELALVNGKEAQRGQVLEAGDQMETRWITTLEGLCRRMGMATQGRRFLRGGEPIGLEETLENGDVILSEEEDYSFPRAVVTAPATTTPEPQAPAQEPTADGPVVTVTLNQRPMELHPKADKSPYLFMDMLALADIDPTKPQGDIVLKVNGSSASYLQEIHPGDEIQIYWSQRNELL